jgi:diacylglycerol kinase (ATP)
LVQVSQRLLHRAHLTTSISVIANPAAGRREGRERLAEFSKHFPPGRIHSVHETQASGDEERLALLAISEGADTLVAIGGDGTCGGVARAILASRSTARLAVVPAGTGNDFAKTLGLVNYTAGQIASLVEQNNATRVDVGIADDHFFINSCGFGFVASVLEATRRVRLLKGDAVYIYSALRQLFTYQGISVSMDANSDADAGKMLMLTVSNGRFLGGAFRIAPHASVVDGKLDIGFFGDTGLVGRVRIFAGAFRGTHVAFPTVKTKRVSEMTLRFPAPPMMEVDGELRQALSSTVKIECVPRSLNVISAPGFPV